MMLNVTVVIPFVQTASITEITIQFSIKVIDSSVSKSSLLAAFTPLCPAFILPNLPKTLSEYILASLCKALSACPTETPCKSLV